MVTIFTHCKGFDGHIATIQRNAIESWLRLRPHCEVLLCGNREGTAEVANEFGLRHLREIRTSEYGTPLVNDLFEKAQRLATCKIMCYANCDIIFRSGFMQAVQIVSGRKKRFLMVGECWNLDVREPLDVEQPDWEDYLEGLIQARGKRRGPRGLDFFVFPRGFYQELPPFVLGTAYYDNWLVWRARALGAAAVDASPLMMPIHQEHDYAHISGGYMWTHTGNDARRNLELAGGPRHIYLIYDTTHRLSSTGLKLNIGTLSRFKCRWETQMELWWRFVEFTRPIRHRLGLHMTNLERFKGWLGRQG
jgi:hypothetical protein